MFEASSVKVEVTCRTDQRERVEDDGSVVFRDGLSAEGRT